MPRLSRKIDSVDEKLRARQLEFFTDQTGRLDVLAGQMLQDLNQELGRNFQGLSRYRYAVYHPAHVLRGSVRGWVAN